MKIGDKLEVFLKSDRQWPRHLRIAHAKLRLKQSKAAKDELAVEFWNAVISANGTLMQLVHN